VRWPGFLHNPCAMWGRHVGLPIYVKIFRPATWLGSDPMPWVLAQQLGDKRQTTGGS